MPPPPPTDLMSRTLEASSSRKPTVSYGRRRMQPEQLQALQTLYDANTHPTKAQRMQLARELDLDLKSVNVWYQNKRRSMKKKLAAWKEVENTSNSGSTASLSPKTNPALRRNPSYTLDYVASSRERRDTRPPLCPRHHAANHANEYYEDYEDCSIPENIYELIPSSPPQAPSSPDLECTFLSGLPRDSKTMRSLEWACAKDRAVLRRKAKERRMRRVEEDADVPALDLDEGFSSEGDADELITPDASLQSVSVPAYLMKPSPRKPHVKTEDGRADADAEAAQMLLAIRGA